jgi:hypothetical protein
MGIYWKRRGYTEAEFIEAWATSKSIAECARKLNLTIFGSTYISLKSAALELGLDQSHMTGQVRWTSETNPRFKGRSDEEVFIYGKYESSDNLKRRVLKYKPRKCEICGLETWLDKPAPIALDHIDGNRLNNLFGNLRLLCYNCHGQTETFAGKNVGKQT